MTTLPEAIKQRLAKTDIGDPLLLEYARRLAIAEQALTWLCVKDVHYDTDIRQAPNLTEDAWQRADEALAAITAPFEDRG